MSIEKCLAQLNNILIAAGKAQPGQVVHRIRLAREELEKLQRERDEAACIHLGDRCGLAYRLRDGEVEVQTNGAWCRSLTFYHPSESSRSLHTYVARKLGEHFGLDLQAQCNESEQRELRAVRAELDHCRQVLRDISNSALAELND